MRRRLVEWRDRWLPPGSVRKRLGVGAFWSFAGTVCSNVFGLATGVLTARLLGQSGYGELGIVVSTYALFAQFGGLGLGITATKHLAELRESNPDEAGKISGAALTTAAVSYLIAAAVLVAVAEPLARAVLNAPSLAPILRWSGFYLVFVGVNGVQVGILAGFEDFRTTARLNVYRALLNLPLTVAGAWLWGLSGVVGAMIVVASVVAVVFQIAVRRTSREQGVQLQFVPDRSHLAILWRFSLPAFLAGNLVVPSAWAVNAILVNQSSGFREMGLLNAAYQWRGLAILIPNIANRVVLAIQSNLYGKGERRRYHRALVANLAVQSSVSAVVVAGIILGAPWIMSTYGSGFVEGSAVLVWLAVSWVLLAPNWVLWNAMVSSNQVWWGLLFNAIGALVLLSCAWAWREHGAVGIAKAYAVSAAVQLLTQGGYFVLWRRAHLA